MRNKIFLKLQNVQPTTKHIFSLILFGFFLLLFSLRIYSLNFIVHIFTKYILEINFADVR